MRLLRLYSSILVLFFSVIVSAQIPTYYSNIDFSQTDDALKNQINTLIIATYTNQLPYTSASTDAWDIIKTVDLNPSNNQNVLLVYGYDDLDNTYKTDRTRSKDLNCTSNSCIGLWNREHVFAKSLANPSLDTSYPSAGTDVHNLHASDSQMNSSRNNRVYTSGNGNSTITAPL
ncbi:endonuclease [Seonamhaeicola sp. NFXS20]|uniref:endonuclease n=1 Tax=Seonamhaeicola sp. NFXS20 TaxID=2816959 RepID=UPI003B8BFA31